MKTLIALFAAASLSTTVQAAEVPKPLVTLSVKRQVIDSNHEMRGRQGDTKEKTYALRVEIVNTSSVTITDAELTGNALVSRTTDITDKLVKEPLGKLALAPMKANERLSIDLGRITLREMEFRNRKFEEKLEEWKVECLQKQVVIGSAVSSDQFAAREKSVVAVPDKRPAGPAHPFRKR